MAGNLLLADAIVEVWDDAAAMVVVLWKSTLCVCLTRHLALYVGLLGKWEPIKDAPLASHTNEIVV